MKMKDYLFGLLLLLCITGCAGNNFLKLVAPLQENGANYTTGKTLKAKVGTAMISINRSELLPAYKANNFFQPPKLNGEQLPPITIHQEWVARFQEGDHYVINSQEYNQLLGITISKDGVVQPNPFVNLAAVFLWADLSPSKILQSDWQLTNRKLFSKSGYAPTKGSFSCELIYLGKISDYIELQYNEYADSEKKPNFTQIVKYNLAANNHVEFKTFKLRIDAATENEISFAVEDDGGLPWITR